MKKIYFLLAVLFILNITQLVYSQNLKAQLKEQIVQEGAEKANKEFIENFFTYPNTKQRYDQIKPLMTAIGFSSALPSEIDLPQYNENTPSVSSKMSKLQPFQYAIDKDKAEFINQFNVSTSFNNVETSQTIIVHTVLLYSEEKGWQVDDVQFITTIGNENK
ncbi:hypothetical protein [Paenibacillus terrae]|uniref:DUF3993 domain-containing protein n=1 Tax=Paenibacillus terrae TaxID=159743 RepID=A0A0D7WZZ6_9BACL|nr:hypothetical protein [Paenibacillus terrae]KJD43317.1 hypothetical protein QD47_23465 [Paenibacillus terrae]